MNRLLEMEIFVHVVDAGSISGAAERMDMAKSGVSKRLAQLESRLSTTLLTRTTRRIALTNAGTEFYARCQSILNDVREAEAAIADAGGALSGDIRIAAPLSFGIQHLGPALLRFMDAHPDITINVDFNDRQADLVAEGFDVGIRIAKLEDSTLIARRLTTIRHVICASPAYWAEHGKPARPGDLKQHNALRYALAARRNWSYRAPDGTRGSVTVPSTSAANNGRFLADAAARGKGIIRLPVFIVYKFIESGALEPVLTDYEWNPLTAWAVYPETHYVPARVRALIDFLSGEFGAEPYWERCMRRWSGNN
jgi:DNA-binding transcriptional LysR family regulator